ncbi:MAG: ATP-dependent DNA ligase [Nitriliruptorales bacterium]
MRLERIAAAWQEVGATRSRTRKIELLGGVLSALPPEELAAGTAMLAGEARQGRIGVGWRTLQQLDVPAATDPSLTVADVDGTLDRLGAVSGPGSVAERQRLLADLFGRATATEQNYLRGLLLGELRQGALEGVVVEAVARAADLSADAVRRAAMLAGDVTAAAVTAMTEGGSGLSRYRLEVGRPVQPMLAQSAEDVASALERTGEAFIDTKFDGMRIQVHRAGPDVAVFTRSLRDVTADLPGVVAAIRELPVEAAVLDGEALATAADGRPIAFQDTMRGDAALRPYLFDALHADGDDVLDRSLEERAEILDGFAKGLVVPRIRTRDAGEGNRHLRTALDAGHEGVMIKAVDAPYEAGRRGAAWIKVKVAHTLDLVVLAVEWGSGRRQGWLSNLHLGAYDPEAGGFVMLGKTFKGLTDELLAWQTEQLLAREVRREGHVVHVRPELVVEIAFDGVQRSTRYPGGVALRFARVKRYRTDKAPQQADTIDTLLAIHRGEVTPRA